jgi:regulator of sirC expression with transglutaminase-like and TPR domain
MKNRRIHAEIFGPLACHPPAFELFKAQVPKIETAAGLRNAHVAIAMHAFEDIEPEQVKRHVQRLARQVRQQVRSQKAAAVLAHLHDVIFDERFMVMIETPRHRMGRYLATSLQLREATQEMFPVIYKLLGHELGLTVNAIRYERRTLMKVFDGDGWLYIDPCAGGSLVDLHDLAVASRPKGCEAFGVTNELDSLVGTTPILPLSHRTWLVEELSRLSQELHRDQYFFDCAAMNELRSLLSDPVLP